jgi:hypothetical protein
MKGIIAMKDDDQRFVVQAVHMRLEGVPSVRGNRMKSATVVSCSSEGVVRAACSAGSDLAWALADYDEWTPVVL